MTNISVNEEVEDSSMRPHQMETKSNDHGKREEVEMTAEERATPTDAASSGEELPSLDSASLASDSSPASRQPPPSSNASDEISSDQPDTNGASSQRSKSIFPAIPGLKKIHPTTESRRRPFQFDPDGPMYMAHACCELLHYRVAAVVVGVLELLMLAGWIAFDVIFYRQIGTGGINATLSITSQIMIGTLGFVCICLMFYGIYTERPYLLWPHMVFQILGIALGIILTIIAVVSMAAGTFIAEEVFGAIFGPDNLPLVATALGPIWPFCLAVIFDFGAAIGIWFYILVKGGYDYLLDKKFFEKYSQQRNVARYNHVEEMHLENTTPKNDTTDHGPTTIATTDESANVHRRHPARKNPEDEIETCA